MTNILLLCSSGLSTSLLVNRMRKAAKEKDLEINVWATGTGAYKEDAVKADVILLGPQVRFMLREVQKALPNTPIDVIESVCYRTMNGDAVINQAMKLLD